MNKNEIVSKIEMIKKETTLTIGLTCEFPVVVLDK